MIFNRQMDIITGTEEFKISNYTRKILWTFTWIGMAIPISGKKVEGILMDCTSTEREKSLLSSNPAIKSITRKQEQKCIQLLWHLTEE